MFNQYLIQSEGVEKIYSHKKSFFMSKNSNILFYYPLSHCSLNYSQEYNKYFQSILIINQTYF